MPGAPFIYYGDEIGMRYVEGLVSKEGGYGRTGARSPMQWDSSKNAKLQWKRAKFCILQEKAQNIKMAATKLKVELP